MTTNPSAIVEYRSTKVERISWLDKVSGLRKEAIAVTHYVEIPDGQLSVREPNDYKDEKDYKGSYVKGKLYTLQIKALSRKGGALTAIGQLVLTDK